jgi:hypothetical protein
LRAIPVFRSAQKFARVTDMIVEVVQPDQFG